MVSSRTARTTKRDLVSGGGDDGDGGRGGGSGGGDLETEAHLKLRMAQNSLFISVHAGLKLLESSAS